MVRKIVLLCYGMAAVAALCLFVELGHALEKQGVISPGEGVNAFRINEPPPPGTACGKQKDMETICREGRVAKITVTSPAYSVEKNRLRVGSQLGDIFKYYGAGEKEMVPGRIILKYPAQGIDFTIDRSTEHIVEITVYTPIVTSAPVRNYEKFKKQLQQ